MASSGKTGNSISLRSGLIRSGLPGLAPARDLPLRVAPGWLQRFWRGDVAAMTLPWVVYVAPDAIEAVSTGNAADLLAHEAVHVAQWQRLGTTRFVLRYVFDYLRGRAAGLPHAAAYRAIGLEREAVAEAVVATGRNA
jgi:hypothetical protein